MGGPERSTKTLKYDEPPRGGSLIRVGQKEPLRRGSTLLRISLAKKKPAREYDLLRIRVGQKKTPRPKKFCDG